MNKCDGIKILELDPKRILEGNEYMVIAEKDQNFKAPINQIVDLVVSDDRLKNYIDTTIESSIGDFKNEVNQSISELTSKINNLDSKITNVNISENKISVLDPVQQAMNKGTGVTLALPSANNGKISLPIWTGTEAEYNQLTKVAGMTYNIIDEESE